MEQSSSFELIDTVEQLENLIPELKVQRIIGVDIESNSMYRYNQSISLLQIAVNNFVYLIDTTKLGVPQPLIDILQSNKIAKVFQDMQYDLALFKYQLDIELSNVWDISIEDRLLRNSPQNRSMDKLIRSYLDEKVTLPSSLQKSNWEIRPLTENQIKYAVTDTSYIVRIHEILCKKLSKDYRAECLKEFLQSYQVTDIRRKYNVDSMWKIKGIDTLGLNSKLILKKMLLERDKLAIEVNRPIHWIARERVMLHVLRERPASKNQFSNLIIIDQPKYLRDQIVDRLYDVYTTPISQEEIDQIRKSNGLRPKSGQTLRKWIPIVDTPQHNPVNSIRLGLVKDWLKIVSKNTELLPEFILSKENRVYLASDRKHVFDFNAFPGLIFPFKELFQKDLIEYLVTEKSQLTYSKLNNIYSAKLRD